jgi:peroxiredoxin
VGDAAPVSKLWATTCAGKVVGLQRQKSLYLLALSLDTSVCDTEVRKFNEQAISLAMM